MTQQPRRAGQASSLQQHASPSKASGTARRLVMSHAPVSPVAAEGEDG